ncbi:putative F-box/kelch-repeat protein [Cardamine amara subsp. amara]|uniref:F-box/kelch-repeat protein n=1 Tax=Cardamine amara subsp. amara TaxID=228776 RepID=A0ABD1B8B6_CARAN
MKGRFAIRGCSQSTKNEEIIDSSSSVCGLLSLPDEVALNCMAQVSRLDLAAVAMASKRHRSLVVSPELWDVRCRMGSMEASLYVLMQIFPDPSPRWFILHPVQRRLKPVKSSLYADPETGSCFVVLDWGICTIGGLKNGKPTPEVSFFDCFEHKVYLFPPMKMARCGASASLIDKKIYVFGGCWDVADSSNWVEVFDFKTLTWDFLFVFTPKMPLNIQQSVVMIQDKEKEVYAVDEDGQHFSFSPSKCILVPNGKTDSNPEYRNDWLSFGPYLLCRGIGGRILWCFPYQFDWKEVKGLEELQQRCGCDDIIKLCFNSATTIAIFWKARPQALLELWYAKISLEKRIEGDLWGEMEFSGPVLSDSSTCVNFLHAACVYG